MNDVKNDPEGTQEFIMTATIQNLTDRDKTLSLPLNNNICTQTLTKPILHKNLRSEHMGKLP